MNINSTNDHRHQLLELLYEYKARFQAEAELAKRFIQFVQSHEDCFERSLLIGHVTASVWLTDTKCERVLLTHHIGLNAWLQLGGHADGCSDPFAVALKEAREESGINEIEFIQKRIFDLDIHRIPAKKKSPEHLHYDVRFLCQTVVTDDYTVSDESHDLKWVDMKQLSTLNVDESILRMQHKFIHHPIS